MSLQDSAVFFRELARDPIVITHGEGPYLYDRDGKRYLDGASGAAVACLGHGNAEIAELMADQAKRVAYAHPLKFASDPMLALAEALKARAPEGLGRIYFTSGGSESTEAAMKLARQYHVARGKDKFKVISRRVSYHGATLGALSVSGQLGRREVFGPLLLAPTMIAPAYPYRCEFCRARMECSLECIHELERAILDEGPAQVAAFIAEPIVGSSSPGTTAPKPYWEIVREVCDRYDVLFIADEVMSGNGRSGKWWAMQHTDVAPDIIVTAKGIGAGYSPLGAMLVRNNVFDTIRGSGNFRHGHTYAGNPVSCALGLKVIEIIERDGLLENVKRMGALLLKRLHAALGDHPHVGDIRGQGLLLGVELVADKVSRTPFPAGRNVQTELSLACLRRGLYLYQGGGSADGVNGDHLLIAPPFIIDETHAEEIVASMSQALKDVLA